VIMACVCVQVPTWIHLRGTSPGPIHSGRHPVTVVQSWVRRGDPFTTSSASAPCYLHVSSACIRAHGAAVAVSWVGASAGRADTHLS